MPFEGAAWWGADDWTMRSRLFVRRGIFQAAAPFQSFLMICQLYVRARHSFAPPLQARSCYLDALTSDPRTEQEQARGMAHTCKRLHGA
jgi:hypothetical protein